jgi:nitrate/nitrite transporter NarK
LGDITSLIFASVVIETLGIPWEIANLIWKTYIIVIAVLMYKGLNDEEQKVDELN